MADSVLDEVRTAVAELEAQCHRIAPVIDRHDWKALEGLLSEMARARHGLANAWQASAAERTAAFEEEIRARVARVLDYRQYQLARLDRFREETGDRLRLISRWRSYARSVAGKRMPQAALFSETR